MSRDLISNARTCLRAFSLIFLLPPALLCAAASSASAQTLTVTGGGGFGYVYSTATLSLSGVNCLGSDQGSPYEGSIMVSVAGYLASADVYVQGNPAQVYVDSTQFVLPGTYPITASFSGYYGVDSSGNSCSVSYFTATGTVIVPQGMTSTSVALPTNRYQSGQSITIPVSIAMPCDEQSQPPLTGNLTLDYGSVAFASGPVNGPCPTASATFTTSTTGVPAGTYKIIATYSGDPTYLSSSSSPFLIKILPAQVSTSTSLSITPNPSVTTQPTTLNVAVMQTGTVTPTGKVTLLAAGHSVGTITLDNTGAGSITIPADIAPGHYQVQALYNGDSFNLPSTSTAQTVTILANTNTSTSVTISPSTVIEGQTTQLSVSVTPQIGNTPPAGSVTISANGTALTTLPLQNGAASINVSTASYPPGNYSVVAKYLGSATDLPSQSTAEPVTISKPTAVTVGASPNPVTKGNVTTLTATVVDGSGAPITSGTVNFSYSGNALGSATLNASGIAQLPISTSALATGSYVIQAAFTGDQANPPATGTVTLVVQ